MIVVSNRGPFRFVQEDGGCTARPAGGGLASALRPLLLDSEHPVTWLAAAISEGDRVAVETGAVATPGVDLVLLTFDPDIAHRHYDVVSNQVLWFLHHGLFDLVRRPTFDHEFTDAWAAYTEVNRAFADGVVERAPEGDVVLVQDYQLALTAGMVAAARPDLQVVHFTHTPFCGPNSVRVLPTRVAEDLLGAMGAVPSGFHTDRWARAYAASAREVLGSDTPAPAFAAPLGPDPEELSEIAASAGAVEAGRALDALVGDRRLLLRIDRIEPSKNIVRGFAAFDRLLERSPEWRERVVFVARCNPSRESLPEYAAYRRDVEAAVDAVNNRWATGDWLPIVLDTRDDYAASVAALARSDVLFVNPVKDGLNLVAKEGPLVNTRDGVLCCSPEAGAFAELHAGALAVHPFDVEQNAHALAHALSMPADERAARAARLRAAAGARTPRRWLDDQISRARRPGA